MRTPEQLQEMAFREQAAKRNRMQRLVENWSKVATIGEGLKESYALNPKKIENTALVLENTSNEMAKLSENQTSIAYNGLTPENALRVIRLGYPNSNRGEAFHEFAMESAEDGVWFLSPVYSTTKRDATLDNVTHESDAYRYSANDDFEALSGTVDGTNKVFTGATGGNLGNAPIKPFFVRIVEVDPTLGQETQIAVDDGSGNLVGAKLDSSATNTVDYTTGAITVTYTTAPAVGSTISVQYVYDYEDPTQYEDQGEVELRLRKVNFKLRRFSLGITWSKQSELVLGSTLDIDAEEALVTGAADELRKSLDIDAFKLGYRTAVAASGANYRKFDTDHLSAGTDNPKDHAQTLKRVFLDVAADIRKELNRGGISAYVCGSYAANYIQSYMDGFSPSGADPAEIGIHKIGTLDGKPVFSVPNTNVMPGDEIYTVWNNVGSTGGMDAAISFGTLLPMYKTMQLEYKNFYKEQGLAEFGDRKVLQSKYLRRIKLENVDRY